MKLRPMSILPLSYIFRGQYNWLIVLKPVHNCSNTFIFLPPLKVILSRQKIQTAVETDKFTKVHQRMAMFDSVCN